MSTNAQTKPLEFTGSSCTECEQFIHAVRGKAFEQGKDLNDDTFWIAQYASTGFSGDALRWHTTLDDSTRQDWSLLEKALLKQYQRPEDTITDTDVVQSPTVSTPTSPLPIDEVKTSPATPTDADHPHRPPPPVPKNTLASNNSEETVKYRARVRMLSPGILPGYVTAFPGDEVDVLHGTVGFSSRVRLDDGTVGYMHSILLKKISDTA